MSCAESETRDVILAKLFKEIERKVDGELDSKLSVLASRKCAKIDSLHLESLENELYEKFKNLLRSGDELNLAQEMLFTNYDGYEFDDYEAMIDSVSNDKSAPVKLKALQKLLESQVVDVTHKRWHRLSKNLQHCFISTNDEVFATSLKMHYKLISFPSTSCEGYLSLVQGLEMIFNNRCFLNKQHFDANNKLQKRAVQVAKVLIKTESFVLKNLVQTKFGLLEELLVVLCMLVCRGQENSTLFEILSILDSKADWFCCLFYSVQTRNAVLKRCVNVVKIAVLIIVNHTNKVANKHSSKYKSDVCKLSHAFHIVKEVVKYEKGQALFPIKLFATITINQLLLMCVVKANELHLRSETKNLFVAFIENMCDHFDNETLKALLEPFTVNTFDLKQCYEAVENNPHIIHILNTLTSKKPLNLLYGYHKQKSSKYKQLHSMPSASPLQTINDLATVCIRHFINICELEHQVKEPIIEFLHCCKSLYAIHPVSFLICPPDKLISGLKDFHDTIGSYNVNLHYKLDLANILGFFFTNYPSALKIVTQKRVLLHEILNCVSDQLLLLIPLLAEDEEGYDVLKNNAAKIIGAQLERIWVEEDNIWEESFETVLGEFLQTVQAISVNFKAFECFMVSESEGTLIGEDVKPSSLAELVEAALNPYEEDLCVSLVALRTLKILLGNPDVAVYLEKSYNLQESLQNIQESFMDTTKKLNSTPLIIDELSSLRLSIIKSLNFNLTDAFRESSALKRRNKLSELQQFLNRTRSGIHDNSWLFQARKFFRHTIEGTYNVMVLVELAEHMERFRKTAGFWKEENGEGCSEVSPEDYVAIKHIVKRGISVGLLSFASQCEEHLLAVLQQFYSAVDGKKERFIGFPWIVGVVFIFCSGNVEKTKRVLASVLHRYLAIFWPNGVSDDAFNSYFHQQLILSLEDNYSEINQVLESSGISAAVIAKKWLQTCFFNVLELEEILSFLMMSILFPVEYMVAFVVALFNHLKPHLFELAQNSQLHEMTDMTALLTFRMSKHLPLIDNLSKQYKTFFCY